MPQVLRSLADRSSTTAFTGLGPSPDDIERILRAAATVPDHGRLRPWRFVVVRGRGRHRFGDALAAALVERDPDAGPERRTHVHAKAFVAPALIVIVASPQPHPTIPRWEQVASAACTGLAILLAAEGLGLGAGWKSAADLDGRALRDLLDLAPGEMLLGWINVGQPDRTRSQTGRAPADLQSLVTILDS